MADVFISYSRKDPAWAQLVVRAFNGAGLSCWFDQEIDPDSNWRETIERELDDARCVVVLWTPQAVRARFVISESERAYRADKLIQCVMEPAEPPLGFGARQYHDLVNWAGDANDPRWRRVEESVKGVLSGKLVGSSEQASRVAASSRAANAWAHVARSIDAQEYHSFIKRYPDDPLVKLANERLRDIQVWAGINKQSSAAIRQFILDGPFDRLIEEAQRLLPSVVEAERRGEEQRRRGEEQRRQEAVERQAAQHRAKAEAEKAFRKANAEAVAAQHWREVEVKNTRAEPIYLALIALGSVVLLLPFSFALADFVVMRGNTNLILELEGSSSGIVAAEVKHLVHFVSVTWPTETEPLVGATGRELLYWFGIVSCMVGSALAASAGSLDADKVVASIGGLAKYFLAALAGLLGLGLAAYVVALILPAQISLGIMVILIPLGLLWMLGNAIGMLKRPMLSRGERAALCMYMASCALFVTTCLVWANL